MPDYCELLLDRRLLPGETVDGELDVMLTRLDRLKHDDPDFEFEIEPFELRLRAGGDPGRLAVRGAGARTPSSGVTGDRPAIYGTPYASDVRNLVNDAGIEAVTFGPGNVAECHCADERVSITEVERAAQVIDRVAQSLLFP